jgi:hypothetical protein
METAVRGYVPSGKTTNYQTPFRSQPVTVEETGLGLGQLIDLCIKTIYYSGRPSAREICESMAISFNVMEGILAFLKREKIIETVGSSGLGEQQYQYALTDKGVERGTEALEKNQYVGPAPVPFDDYVTVVHEQSIRKLWVNDEIVARCLGDLVLDETTYNLVGPAVNSGRSLLLYGEPGNGKSSIAKGIGRMLHGNILIPYAIDVNGQTIRVFDPRVHTLVEEEVPEERQNVFTPTKIENRRDPRWALCKRPLIITGGELTLADLDLKYSAQAKFYTAPLQMKANCGILVIDDFGRQLVPPAALLNRWIVPMEARVDYLSLLSGDTIEIPFELFLVFSTNIPPQQLGDEAFFRRIRYKLEVLDPSEPGFLEILRKICEVNSIPYSHEGGVYLVDKFYRPKNRNFRGVHPRDITDLLIDIASFQGREPAFTPEWIDLACASYFIDDKAKTKL